jgi:hypothetical protein
MKVLFLDINGVLNSTESARNNKSYSVLIPEGLKFLHYLHSQGVMIVVSSTWRLLYTKDNLAEILAVPIRDVTPKGPCNSCRGEEIQTWLNANGSPEYCIIDDDGDMLPYQIPRFVKTSCEDGMLPHHMDEVCRVLSLPSFYLGALVESATENRVSFSRFCKEKKVSRQDFLDAAESAQKRFASGQGEKYQRAAQVLIDLAQG